MADSDDLEKEMRERGLVFEKDLQENPQQIPGKTGYKSGERKPSVSYNTSQKENDMHSQSEGAAVESAHRTIDTKFTPTETSDLSQAAMRMAQDVAKLNAWDTRIINAAMTATAVLLGFGVFKGVVLAYESLTGSTTVADLPVPKMK